MYYTLVLRVHSSQASHGRNMFAAVYPRPSACMFRMFARMDARERLIEPSRTRIAAGCLGVLAPDG